MDFEKDNFEDDNELPLLDEEEELGVEEVELSDTEEEELGGADEETEEAPTRVKVTRCRKHWVPPASQQWASARLFPTGARAGRIGIGCPG